MLAGVLVWVNGVHSCGLNVLKRFPSRNYAVTIWGSVHAHRCILSRICAADGYELLHVREGEFYIFRNITYVNNFYQLIHMN